MSDAQSQISLIERQDLDELVLALWGEDGRWELDDEGVEFTLVAGPVASTSQDPDGKWVEELEIRYALTFDSINALVEITRSALRQLRAHSVEHAGQVSKA